jgi:hypothetical protein
MSNLDAALIAICEQYIRHCQSINPIGYTDEMEEEERLRLIIMSLRPVTIEGFRAKARAVVACIAPDEFAEGVLDHPHIQEFVCSVLRDLAEGE